jgi:hypothetical protein
MEVLVYIAFAAIMIVWFVVKSLEDDEEQ